LEYACSPTRPGGGELNFPEYRPWNPFQACKQKYPITTYQPLYFVAQSLQDAKEQMREFTEDMKKPFYARYNPYQQTISVDRAVAVQNKAMKTS
jgi:phenylalanine-4-hydroxylase